MTTVVQAGISLIRSPGNGSPDRDQEREREAERALERCDRRMELAVQSLGGAIASQARDGRGACLVARFAGREDAFEVAVLLLQRVSALPPPSRTSLEIRVGVAADRAFPGGDATAATLTATAARLADQAAAGQILFCLGAERARALGQGDDSPARLLPAQDFGQGGLAIAELGWHGEQALAAARRLALTLWPERPCRVRHGERELVMDQSLAVLTIGRHPDCHVVLQDRRASRHHARLERRGARLVVVDESANGTYIRRPGQGEVLLCRGEMALSGSGELGFAASPADPGGERLSFLIPE